MLSRRSSCVSEMSRHGLTISVERRESTREKLDTPPPEVVVVDKSESIQRRSERPLDCRRTLVPCTGPLGPVRTAAVTETVGPFSQKGDYVSACRQRRMVAAGSWRAPGETRSGRVPSALDSTNIGRLAYCTDFGPRIVPMNYTVVSDALIFRTGMDTEASGHVIDHPVAFEVDQVDEFLQAGWSVLVVGHARLMDEGSLRLLDLWQSPQSWPEGRRPLVIELPLTTITGRRVHPS